MASRTAARRYAKALFQIAKESGDVDSVRSELARFEELLEGNDELRQVVLTPLRPASERRGVLEQIAERLGAGPMLHNFFAFLIDQRRLVDHLAIREEFERLANEEAGITLARVRSATPLREEQIESLRRALSARTGHNLEVSVDVDESLLGGVVAQIGDLVFDGSLRTQLEQLRTQLVNS